jgi:hypothetical protein
VSRQRLDVKQAAEALGISSEGVRKRIKRGSLQHEKGSDGRVYVWLDSDRTNNLDTNTQLVETLREQIETLRSDLTDWKRVVATRDEELRRKDHFIAALTERIPELEPTSKPHISQGTTMENEYETAEAPATTQADLNPHRKPRPWWRRIMSG